MKKKVTSKEIESKLKKLKNITIDGNAVVVILGSLLKKAKIITRELNKKNLNSITLHDLNVQSRTIRELIDDMLQGLENEAIRQQLKPKHAKVGRK